MIKKLSTITLAAVAMLTLSACSGEKVAETKTYSKTTAEVYQQSCIKCHGAHGNGKAEKKTPRLDDRTAAELEQDLFDVKNGGTNQSSGTDHEIMEHNMQKLIDKGYDYDIKAMAEYMYGTFKK
jgi:cytochrome c553